MENLREIVEIVRNCFQTRDFSPMVELFSASGIYETPYAQENNRSEGIEAIRRRFAQVTESPWNKAVKIDEVRVNTISSVDGRTIIAEFFIKGTRRSDQAPFDFPSSVAIITVHNGQIEHYKDFPNVAGIRAAAMSQNG
jgi:ketosteroid isomerase-like protein